ncbi:heat-inducible transcription repressor HrcA [Spiribacter sp. 2438]|uniref:heat-inducible transcriptional repressor HrcA n=1 Tax=Spiribacter sp. 2438 TaxID=2666185 RepID=UPI0012AF4467|nr:heat-inducible transcriptional repressor HrcA [Spiribacter sp. 2438]QGM21674.1 heat-inducible transcription repressor HrcA [Spiribacter sp. 2438]
MVRQTGDEPLSERAQYLLRALVHRHIRDGQPVGSRALTREAGLDLSAASVRNVMADLEEAGYIQAPHTSAGRIPTDRGYRFFVDSLLNVRSEQGLDPDALRIRLDAGRDAGELVDSASNLLSGLTHLAGVVTLPKRDYGSIRHIEFLPLSEQRILSIVVLNDHEVQNRVIETDRNYSQSELQQVSNYLSAEFAGKSVSDVRRGLLDAMQADQQHMNVLMTSAIQVANELFREGDADSDDFVMAGETNLMTFAELSSVEKLKELFEAFGRKRDILHLLDRCLSADGVQIFIGQESGYKAFDGVSLVTSTYQTDDQVLGVLGVIGPTRMEYDRVIPIVDVTARLLGHALKSEH